MLKDNFKRSNNQTSSIVFVTVVLILGLLVVTASMNNPIFS